MTELLKLRRYLEPPKPRRERCEFCGVALPDRHTHAIDVEKRRLMCTCRPCYLLFLGGEKFRSVPERYVNLAELALSEELPIPVGMAFFVRNSKLGGVSVFYPSPAGATEAAFPAETWEEMVAANAELGAMEPDVEALLLCRRRGRAQTWIVPVDACYELVGRIRAHWRGFEGGEEAWTEIDAFFQSWGGRSFFAACPDPSAGQATEDDGLPHGASA
jgi:hypothetical protein